MSSLMLETSVIVKTPEHGHYLRVNLLKLGIRLTQVATICSIALMGGLLNCCRMSISLFPENDG